ncbi:MAG: hypothetical protein KC657_27465 [Myxococcales bacterium]|nr:hypothetical protein [Myxococcales bacterium]
MNGPRPTTPPVPPPEVAGAARTDGAYWPDGTIVAGFRLRSCLGSHGAAWRYRAFDELSDAGEVELQLVHARGCERFRHGGFAEIERWIAEHRAWVGVAIEGLVRVVGCGFVDLAQAPAVRLVPGPGDPLLWYASELRSWRDGARDVSWERWLAAARAGARVGEAVHRAGRTLGGDAIRLMQDEAGATFVLPPAPFAEERSIYTAAPETDEGGPPTPASDVFVLGHTLHQLLDGGHGYEHVELLGSARMGITSGVLQWKRAGVADEVRTLLRRMVQPRPAARPSMSEVCAALDALDVARLGVLGPTPAARAWEPPGGYSPAELPRERDEPAASRTWWQRLWGRGS